MDEPRPPATIAAAYSVGGGAWSGAPARIYARLAEELLDRSPVALAGARVADVGAGTGVASTVAAAAGALVVAADVADGILRVDQGRRPPAVVADGCALSLATGRFDLVVAAFSYNHLADPAPALAEARRVLRPGGALLASVYAQDDTHPVKHAVEAALVEVGYEAPPFYSSLKGEAMPQLATVERADAAAHAAGFATVSAINVRVPFPELTPTELVEWRLGMAQHAWFAEALEPMARAALVGRALALLGEDPPPLERSVIDLVAIV